MSDSKVSQLSAAVSAAGADLLLLVQGGQSLKLTIANFLANLNSPVVINSASADQDSRVQSQHDNACLFVDASADKVGVGTPSPGEKLDINGNINVQGFPRYNGTPQAVTGNGALTTVSVSAYISQYSVNAGGTSTTTLADGTNGQKKVIFLDLATGNLQITPSNLLGYSTITMTHLGASVELIFLSGKWRVVGSQGCTLV
jgi:hypothetical protein